MNHELEKVLRDIEQDMSAEVAAAFTRVAADYFNESRTGDRPVSSRLTPSELAKRFETGFPAGGMPLTEVLSRLESDVVHQSNWLYHPRYMGHQVTAPLPAAVWMESIIGALNQSVAVQEMSPAITMVEYQIVKWMAKLAGFGATAGGTLTSGGTEANFTALLAARARALPDAWKNGLEGKLPVVLCGEHAHYAITRAVAQLGLGLNRAIAVKSRSYRMDVQDLATKLAALEHAGTAVMAVVATSGSTPTGSFDDLPAIADLCDQYGIWLHVDGAHGASAVLSETRRSSLIGLERARSIAWDPHKMMLMPLSVGVVLVRDEADLDAAFQQSAPYLFHSTDQQEKNWDQGGRSFQCSRRGEALKMWVALQRYGTAAFGLLYDHFCDLTAELYGMLAAHPAFDVLHEPEGNILCFRYIGREAHDEGELNELNHSLRMQYNTAGTGWITTTVLDGRRVLRTTLMNPRTRGQHLEEMIAELEGAGIALENYRRKLSRK